MKKMLSLAAALSVASLSFVEAASIVSVSYTKAFSECKEGQELSKKFNDKGSELRKKAMDFQKEFTDKQAELKKQEKVLTKEAMDEKLRQYEDERKKIGTQLAQEEYKLQEEAKAEYQEYQMAQKSRIDEIRETKKWDAILAQEHTLSVAKNLDKTDEVVKLLDLKYEEVHNTTKLANNSSAKTKKNMTKINKKSSKVA